MKRHFTFVPLLILVSMFGVITSCSEDCDTKTWYEDADNDGFGNASSIAMACDKPNGYVSDSTDFNDTSAAAYPGASEDCTDGVDNDGDGFLDCADFDCNGQTGCQPEICDDNIDNDGDGFTDCNDLDCSGVPPCP